MTSDSHNLSRPCCLQVPDRPKLTWALTTDRRAVSTPAGYAMTLVITTLLLTGLFIGIGNFVQDQRERAVQSEMNVVGHQLAADLSSAIALSRGAAEATGSPNAFSVTLERDLPSSVAGTDYVMELRDTGGADGADELELRSTSPDVTVQVQLAADSQVEIREATLDGGDVQITFAASGGPVGQVEVSNA